LELVASFLDTIYSGLARRNGVDQHWTSYAGNPLPRGFLMLKTLLHGITFHHPKQFSMEDFVEVENAI